jgi:anti-sigma factor RsiW
MSCLDVQMSTQTYIDGELSAEQATLLEQHLASCPECRAELARLRAVMTALETWPTVVEPEHLTNRIMRQVSTRPVMPTFRLRWSDLAISLAGATGVFAAMWCWRDLTSTDWTRLYRTQLSLQLEMLRLEALLQARRLFGTIGITPAGGLAIVVGVMLIVALVLTVWDLTGWHRKIVSVT